jgi:ABC-type sugar transport system substrate-binding protein
MTYRRHLSVLLAAAMLAATVAACGSSKSSTSSNSSNSGSGATTKSAKTGSTIKVAWFTAVLANTYDEAVKQGLESQAAKQGVKLQIFDAGLNPGTQASQIQDANTKGGYAGYIVEPVSNSVLPEVKAALAKKIQVVTDNTVLGTNQGSGKVQVPGVFASVTTPPSTDGAHIAELTIAACAGKPCQVALMVGTLELPSEVAKVAAIKAAFAGHHNIQLLPVLQGGFTRSGGQTAAQNLLVAHPDVNVIATTGDDMADGAELVLKQQGKTSIKLIGGAASTPGVAAVKSGAWYGTSTKLPVTEGELSIQAIVQAIHGAKGGRAIDPGTASAIGRAIGPVVTKAALQKDPSFTGQWQG